MQEASEKVVYPIFIKTIFCNLFGGCIKEECIAYTVIKSKHLFSAAYILIGKRKQILS